MSKLEFQDDNTYTNYLSSKLVPNNDLRSDDEEELKDNLKDSCFKYENSERFISNKKSKSQGSKKYNKMSLGEFQMRESSQEYQWDKNIFSNSQSRSRKLPSPTQYQEDEQFQNENEINVGYLEEDHQEQNVPSQYQNQFNNDLTLKQIFKKIIAIREIGIVYKNKLIGQNEETELLNLAKNIYKQIIQENKRIILIDLHYITKDNVINIIDFCTQEIIDNHLQGQIQKQQNKSCINVHFITGIGKNQELYFYVQKYLNKNSDLYYIQQQENKGLLNTFIFV